MDKPFSYDSESTRKEEVNESQMKFVVLL